MAARFGGADTAGGGEGVRNVPRATDAPAYAPDCYLCPGNARAGGEQNPAYDGTFVFTNDFAALQPDSSVATMDNGLIQARGERGTCKVMCFSPRHDLTLSAMEEPDVRKVVDAWAELSATLGADFPWVQSVGKSW